MNRIKFVLAVLLIGLFSIICGTGKNSSQRAPAFKGIHLGMSGREVWKLISEDWVKQNVVRGTMYRETKYKEDLLNNPGSVNVGWNSGGGLVQDLDLRFQDNKLVLIQFSRDWAKLVNDISMYSDNAVFIMKLNQTFNVDLKRVGEEYTYIDFNNGWKLTLDPYGDLILETVK